MPDLLSLTCSSLQILDKIQTGLFPISGSVVEYTINKNWHNSRTSNDIYLKLGSITKLETRNRATSKNWRWCRADKLWRHRHVFDLWPIWSDPEAAFRAHGSGSYIFINSNFLSYKNWKQNLKSLTELSYFFEWRYYFCQKCWFIVKNADISKIKGGLSVKRYILWN